MTAFDRLGEQLRKAGPELDAAARTRQRARLVLAVEQTRRRSTRSTSWLLLVPVAVLLMVASGWLVMGSSLRSRRSAAVVPSGPSAATPSAATRGATAPSEERWWSELAVSTTHEIVDRGRLQLSRGASAHMSRSGSRVNVVVNHGRVGSSVDPGRGTRWTVHAGPYSVRAIGTEFTVDYAPERSFLEVRVSEGSVTLTGGQLGTSAVTLHVGQQVVVSGTLVAIDRDDTRSADMTPPSAPTPAPTPEVALPGARPAPPAGSASTATSAPLTESWEQLHARGEHRAALEVAITSGFERLVSELDCDALKRLADTARLARDTARARYSLLALRDRCKGSAHGRAAAFLLGRLVDAADPREASRWYGVYLREAPSGELAEQALGRRIDALLRAGDRNAARAVARRYLAAYPGGVYAELAAAQLAH